MKKEKNVNPEGMDTHKSCLCFAALGCVHWTRGLHKKVPMQIHRLGLWLLLIYQHWEHKRHGQSCLGGKPFPEHAPNGRGGGEHVIWVINEPELGKGYNWNESDEVLKFIRMAGKTLTWWW